MCIVLQKNLSKLVTFKLMFVSRWLLQTATRDILRPKMWSFKSCTASELQKKYVLRYQAKTIDCKFAQSDFTSQRRVV